MSRILFLITVLFIVSCKNQSSNSKETSEQVSSVSVAVAGSCSYTGELNSGKIYAFPADKKAKAALSRIMNYTGLPINFKLLAADVNNACAVIQKNTSGDMLRYIMYNQQFMAGVKDLTKTHWSEISILAHEIGHHLSGHTLLQGGSRPELELEADRFSGFVLYKMRASLEEAQIAMKTFAATNQSSTHPAKKSRLIAITNGWLAAKEQDNPNKIESNDPGITTEETANKTIESASASVREKIISILNRLNQINESFECNALAQFYLPVVDNYYNKSNLTVAEIINECIRYHGRWPQQKISIDNSTFSITHLNNGDYFVTYDMFYQVKRASEDNWKDFYLTINVRFTPELKIKSIYEYQKP